MGIGLSSGIADSSETLRRLYQAVALRALLRARQPGRPVFLPVTALPDAARKLGIDPAASRFPVQLAHYFECALQRYYRELSREGWSHERHARQIQLSNEGLAEMPDLLARATRLYGQALIDAMLTREPWPACGPMPGCQNVLCSHLHPYATHPEEGAAGARAIDLDGRPLGQPLMDNPDPRVWEPTAQLLGSGAACP